MIFDRSKEQTGQTLRPREIGPVRAIGHKLRGMLPLAVGNARGIFLMVVGTLLTTATLVFIRLLGRDLPTAEVVFLRYLFAIVAIAPWILRTGFVATFATRRLGLHAIRGGVAVISTMAWYYGVTVVPLAEALALNCLGAIFVAVGAVVFLGERAGPARWIAAAVGLAGAWLMLRPGIEVVSTGAMIVVLSALGWGATMLFLKVLLGTESPTTIVVYLYVFNTLLAALPAMVVWVTPSVTHLVWLGVVGILSSVGHLAIAQAFKDADASAIAPVDFTRLAWAVLFGYAVFSEIPDSWTMLGATVIFTSTTFMAYREGRISTMATRESVDATAGRS